MEAKELRLGNKFYLPNGEVGTITYHEIRLMVVALEKPNYKPIPLTEEWLLNFGFENLQKESLDGGLAELIHNETIGYIFAPEGAYGHPEIKYVHELQNLYFALTGEELILKQ